MLQSVKSLIPLVLAALILCLGVYTGLWVMFIGGIIDVIEQVKAPSIDAMSLALGIAKVIFANAVLGIFFIIAFMVAGLSK